MSKRALLFVGLLLIAISALGLIVTAISQPRPTRLPALVLYPFFILPAP